jgi:hypothetical protein
MPSQLAIAQTADRLCLRIPEVGDETDLRHDGRCPFGAHDALERSEAGAESSQFLFGKRLPAKHQHRMMRLQLTNLFNGPIVERLPEPQPDNFAGKAVTQRPAFECHEFSS